MEEDKRLTVPKRTSKHEGQQINITMTRNGEDWREELL